jgi:hypothetical protein
MDPATNYRDHVDPQHKMAMDRDGTIRRKANHGTMPYAWEQQAHTTDDIVAFGILVRD